MARGTFDRLAPSLANRVGLHMVFIAHADS
jgi:hypothetical protein